MKLKREYKMHQKESLEIGLSQNNKSTALNLLDSLSVPTSFIRNGREILEKGAGRTEKAVIYAILCNSFCSRINKIGILL